MAAARNLPVLLRLQSCKSDDQRSYLLCDLTADVTDAAMPQADLCSDDVFVSIN